MSSVLDLMADAPSNKQRMSQRNNQRPGTQTTAGCLMSIGVAIMFAVVMCPFCTLHKVMLLTNATNFAEASIAVVVTGMHVQTSLMTMDVAPICGTDIGMLSSTASKFVRTLCLGAGNSMWGNHLVFDINSHVCNLEEQLRAVGGGIIRAFGGDVGCIYFNIAKIASISALALTFMAIVFHVLAAVHTQVYYSVDHSRRRRCIARAFWGMAPVCATTGAVLYYVLVQPQRLVLPRLFQAPQGHWLPVGWGTAWWG